MVLILEKGECLVSPLEFRPLRFRFEKSLGTPKKFFGQEFVVQSSGETRKKLDGVFCCEFSSSPSATTRTALPPLAFIYGTISRTSTIKLEGTRVPPPLLSRVKLKFPVHFRFLKSIKASLVRPSQESNQISNWNRLERKGGGETDQTATEFSCSNVVNDVNGRRD